MEAGLQGFLQGGVQLVAQTQGYQLVCIWSSLVNFQGAGVVLKFDVLPNWDAVFLCSLHASNETLCC